jgi:GPH family glycoside/pentoside/hexuronide:cation symporter
VAEKAQKPALLMPLLNKMLFASDHVGLQAISYFRQSWILFFLVPPVGEGLAMVPDISLLGFDIDARVFAGFLIFAGRFVDAFTDPLIGWWSDRTRSCWGRRIPFILFSTPFYALFAALVWILPSEDASLWNALYVVIVLELFFTAATMSSGALEALVPEITHGASDRMNLVGLIFLFAIFGAGLGLAGSGALVDAFGFQVVGIVLAALGLVFRSISLSAVWKYAPRDTTPAKVDFLRGVRDTLRNPQFVYYLPTFVMFTTGVGILLGWMPFFASQLLQAEEEGTVSGLISTVVIMGAVVSGIVFWTLLTRVGFSKRRVYGGCLVASGVAFPLLGLVGLIPLGSLVMQGLVLSFIAGLPMAAVFMLPKGLTADIADYDAMLTGERREAMFYATQNFFEKVTFALPPALLSLVLLLGDTTANPLGIRLAPVLAGVLALMGIALWHRYRLPDTITRESVTAAGLLRAPC